MGVQIRRGGTSIGFGIATAIALPMICGLATAQSPGHISQHGAVIVADGADDGTVSKVHYQDLNLKTDAGISALYHRVRVAATLACNQSVPAWAPQHNSHWHACLDTAVNAAVTQINNPALAAMHHDAVRAPNPTPPSLSAVQSHN